MSLGDAAVSILKGRRRDILIASDTAVVAATSAGLLLVGARVVSLSDLAALAMLQLIVMSLVGIQRASLLTPALAAQRTTGQGSIPPRRYLYTGLPFVVALSPLVPLALGASDPYWVLGSLATVAAIGATAQDWMRHVLFSRGKTAASLGSDAAWLVVVFGGLAATWILDASWLLLAGLWAAGGWVALCVAVILAGPLATAGDTAIPLRATLALGRWSGGDAALSVAANLMTMVTTTVALASPLAAVYRVLQGAAGPWNILASTFLTVFGLDAWKLDSVDAVARLRSRTIRASATLAVLAAVYYSVALPLFALVSGISDEGVLRVAVILGIAGILQAATIPLMSAATALGQQFVGLILRVGVIGVSIGLSAMAIADVGIPWSDPIGVLALVSSTAGLFAWGSGMHRGSSPLRLNDSDD